MAEPAFDPKQLEQQRLGTSEDVLRTASAPELVAVTDHMAAQAQHNLNILAPDTEPELYGREAFGRIVAELISQRGRVARIRMLVVDPARARHETHRLVELWHRFPSFIEVRELRDVYANTREAFLLADDIGLIRRQDKDDWAAVATYRNLTTARARAAWFEEAWAHSAPCSVLRRLSL